LVFIYLEWIGSEIWKMAHKEKEMGKNKYCWRINVTDKIISLMPFKITLIYEFVSKTTLSFLSLWRKRVDFLIIILLRTIGFLGYYQHKHC
jgi:hypothetical protein